MLWLRNFLFDIFFSRGLKYSAEIFPAGTDSRHLREVKLKMIYKYC